MTSTPDPLPKVNTTQTLSPHEAIYQAVEMYYADLRVSVKVLLIRSGQLDGEGNIDEVTDDLLHDTIETALKISDRFDPARSVRSWLLGIAVKKLSEMGRTIKRNNKRIQVAADQNSEDDGVSARFRKDDSEDSTAEEVIDSVLYRTSNRSSLEDQEPRLNELLGLVKESERQILTLAIVEGLSGADLAASLRIREGAAYVRLARAKEHLRQKYLAIHERKGI